MGMGNIEFSSLSLKSHENGNKFMKIMELGMEINSMGMGMSYSVPIFVTYYEPWYVSKL